MVKITKQERELEKRTAKAYGSLSLGLFATGLQVCSISDGSGWITLLVLGIASALFAIYLAFIHRWKRKEILRIASRVQIEPVAWFLGFSALGIGIIQIGLKIQGLMCVGLGYIILIVGNWKIATEAKRKKKIAS